MCFPSHNAVHQLHQTSLQKIVQLDSRRSTGSTGRGWEAVTGFGVDKWSRLGSRSYPFIIEKGRGWEAVPTRLLLKKVAAGKPLLPVY